MFGVFRCNKNSQNNLEFIDLSGQSKVDARNYTILACDQCRERKLKCSGDQEGCQRCQATSVTCTYRASNRSTENPFSAKRRQSASGSRTRPKLSTKNKESQGSTGYRLSSADELNLHLDMNDALMVDHNDGLWTPNTPSGLDLTDYLRNWEDITPFGDQGIDPRNEKSNPINLDLESITNFQLISTTAPPTVSQTNNQRKVNHLMTPPSTSYGSVVSPQSQDRCHSCLGSLAYILEKLTGDGNQDLDEDGRFDELLVSLREGIDTCKQVLPCSTCCIVSSNSMFLVTVIQQLASVGNLLSEQLLRYKKQDGRATSKSPIQLSGEIRVGKYQLCAESIHLQFLFPIVSMHLKELRSLLEQVREEVKKGSRASKLLRSVVEGVQAASNDLDDA